jgi:hypothetical protein
MVMGVRAMGWYYALFSGNAVIAATIKLVLT